MLMTGMEATENIGKVLGGSYHLVRLIGEGGMGAVYEAEHIRLPRRFAVKLLRADVGADPVAIERFRREADIASSIGHEHIVDVMDFNVAGNGVPYMVLELLEGEDLGTRIKRRGHLSAEELRPIVEQVADALEAAHGRGVIHRDLKPQNIFLCRRGGRDDFIKILDFGISKIVHSPSVVTQAGTVFGTPNYMSPEQAQGPGVDLDPRTDVFTLGVVCYEALTGQLAFDGSSAAATLYKVCHTDPIPPRSIVADLSSAIENVVMRAMTKTVEERWQSARQLAVAFGAACEGRTPPADLSGEFSLHVRPAVPDTDSLAPTTSPVTQPRRRRGSWARRTLGGALVAGSVVAGYLAYVHVVAPAQSPLDSRRQASSLPVPTAMEHKPGPAIEIPAAPPQPAPAPPAAPPSHVKVRLVNLPEGASVQLDGMVVTDNPFELAFAPISREIRVSAPGCAPFVRQVVPLQDASLVVACEPIAVRSRARPSRAAVDSPPAPTPAPRALPKKDLLTDEDDL